MLTTSPLSSDSEIQLQNCTVATKLGFCSQPSKNTFSQIQLQNRAHATKFEFFTSLICIDENEKRNYGCLYTYSSLTPFARDNGFKYSSRCPQYHIMVLLKEQAVFTVAYSERTCCKLVHQLGCCRFQKN